MATYEDRLTLAAFNALGNAPGTCKLVWGTYTGTGKSGEQNPNVLTFDAMPLFIEIRPFSHPSADADYRYRLYHGTATADVGNVSGAPAVVEELTVV